MSQAIALMPAINGYGTLTEGNESTSAIDTAAETFVTEGLSKVLKINNICDADHLQDCGIPTHITTATASNNLELEKIKTLGSYNSMFAGEFSYNSSVRNVPFLDAKAAAFETANGESILLYYNPTCSNFVTSIGNLMSQYSLCANFVYDLNGNKGPNTFGRDIGVISVFYPSDSVVVAPYPVATNNSNFGVMSPEAGRTYCRESFDNARLPNREELMAMAVNVPLFGIVRLNNGFISSSAYDVGHHWGVSFGTGLVYPYHNTTNSGSVWCVNR